MSDYVLKWVDISGSAKIKLVQAGCTLILIKIGLAILPFSTFRKVFHWMSKSDAKPDLNSKEISEVVWAVNTAANIIPLELLCLPRALAAKYLLRKVPSLSLEIGVEVNHAKPFEAHAWIQKGDEIIIGDWSNSVSYQRLWVWE
ncbi:lasso peptide biosynthesis B2 protein [Dyadobacter subterraneus]|uniref:Lasso peptide biosynthesis B2 protein n=1 Tax=Dyadobacter subterraneus TaxID=2773304 RepID=A0ABR9W6T2_9BACT|nr:lasso peptide biosynthesis B2 protein [Dyadobacter subterraneus]MBE9461155.1 lasso peptide biosynthesis B2 protein [Dyadobacter subterraneus]